MAKHPNKHIREAISYAEQNGWTLMKYDFTLYLVGLTEITEDAADALFEAGCDDASPASRDGQVWSTFHREAASLEEAIRSAARDVNKAGYQVQRIELDTDAVAELIAVS